MHFDKHRKSINCLVDVTEAMLNQMEKYDIDTEEISKRPEFTVFVHFLKSILAVSYTHLTLPTICSV